VLASDGVASDFGALRFSASEYAASASRFASACCRICSEQGCQVGPKDL
jgi:hypothetical protein